MLDDSLTESLSPPQQFAAGPTIPDRGHHNELSLHPSLKAAMAKTSAELFATSESHQIQDFSSDTDEYVTLNHYLLTCNTFFLLVAAHRIG